MNIKKVLKIVLITVLIVAAVLLCVFFGGWH